MSTAAPPVETDVSDLETFAFGGRSPLFWATALLCCMEGTALGLLFFSYFYLRENFTTWPPSAPIPPAAGLISTAVLSLSLLPIWLTGKAARTLDRSRTLRWQVISTFVGTIGIALRVWELRTLPFRWTENAYATVVWTSLGFHTFDYVAEMGEMVVLSILLWRGPLENKHFEDVHVNAFFWAFLALAWLPFACVLYFDGGIR